MTTRLLGFVAGSLLALILPLPLAVGAVAVYGLLALGMVLPTVPALVLMAVAGYLHSSLEWRDQTAQWLPAQWENHDFLARGRIVGLPSVSHVPGRPVSSRFDFKLSEPLCSATNATCLAQGPKTLRLNWYGNVVDAAAMRGLWKLQLRLRRPRGLANFNGFDYQRWLLRNGYHATGYVREVLAREDGDAPCRFWQSCARALVVETLRRRQSDLPMAGVMQALAVGERGGIPADTAQRFRHSGTAHLLAISGLHIGIAAGFGWLLGMGLVRCLALFGLPTLGLAWWCSLGLATVYAGLAGFSLPTRRALCMCVVASLILALTRQPRPMSGLAVALFVVLVSDPLSGLDPGFWLSFGAVSILLLVYSGRRQARRDLGLRGQLAIGICLSPLLLVLFGTVAIAGFFANLLLIPVFSLVIVPGCLLALGLEWLFPAAAPGLWLPLNQLLEWMDAYLQFLLGVLPALAVHQPGAGSLSTLAAVAGCCLVLLPLPAVMRMPGVLLLLGLLVAQPQAPLRHGELRLTVLDVGQGLAVMLETRSQRTLYDTGAAYSPRFNMADAAVLPLLRGRGSRRIDTLILSHGDEDHSGALAPLLTGVAVGRIYAGDWARQSSVHVLPSAEPCTAGRRWVADGIRFQFLWPEAGTPWQGNNSSCVLSISGAGFRVLLPGDIEARVERLLLPKLKPVDLVVAPHHGSGTSSTAALVAALKPAMVVFSAGWKHHFGHPRADVVNRYREAGAGIYNTAIHGAVQLRFAPGRPVRVQTARTGPGSFAAQRVPRIMPR